MNTTLIQALNMAAATLCGWKTVQVHPKAGYNPTGLKGIPPYRSKGGQQDNGPLFHPTPNYCEDRNTLPELWELAIERRKKKPEDYDFLDYLVEIEDRCGFAARGHAWHVLMAPCYQHVIAALKACDAWTPELEALWESQTCSS